MIRKNIIIGSPSQIIKYARRLSNKSDWKWCYFGLDIENKYKIERLLSKDRRFYYAEDLRKLSLELRIPFIEWIAKINSYYKDNLKWWASRLASKCPFQTDLFLLFCYFNLVSRISENKPRDDSQLLILIENPFLHKQIESHLSKNKQGPVFIFNPHPKLLFFNFYYLTKAKFVNLLFLWRGILNFFKNIFLRLKYSEKFGQNDFEVMVYTLLDERSFRDGVFKDIYKIGHIGEFYKNIGKKVIFGSQNNTCYSLKKLALSAKESFFLPDFYLKFADWLKAFFEQPIEVRNELAIFKNVNYSVLFRMEYLLEASSTSMRTKLCLRDAFSNYFINNKHVKLFVYFFENQPWEKMVLLALKKTNPNAVTAGYQHAPFSSMELNYFLGENEYEFSPAPDYIISNGSYYEKVLNASGFKLSKIINGGSIRHSIVLNEPVLMKTKEKRLQKNVMFLLQPPLARCLEVVYNLRNIATKNKLYKLFIKPHPGFFNKRLNKIIKNISPDSKICLFSLDEVIGDMDLVVYSSTTAALEALNRGIAVCKINTELIDLDILEELDVKLNRMSANQKIDLDAINFDATEHLSRQYVIGEAIRPETWLALLKK